MVKDNQQPIRQSSEHFGGLYSPQLGNWYEPATWFSENSPEEEFEQAFEQASQKMVNLEKVQTKVDSAIASLDPSHPDYSALVTLRDESRGWFVQYVQDAWNQLMSMMDLYDVQEKQSQMLGMGVVPLVAAGGFAALVAVAYLVTDTIDQNTEKEMAILNHPALSDVAKAKILSGEWFASAFSDTKTIVMVGAGLVGAVYLAKNWKGIKGAF